MLVTRIFQHGINLNIISICVVTLILPPTCILTFQNGDGIKWLITVVVSPLICIKTESVLDLATKKL